MHDSRYLWLKFLDTCASTNTWAKEQRSQLVHGDVVFTPRQTAGRGQRGRTWVSAQGVLTASFVLDLVPIGQLTGLSLVSSLAVIRAVEILLPELRDRLQWKWVNDIWLNRRKLAGILCEAIGDRLIVGVGLNRCVTFADPTAIGYPASLHEFVANVPDELSLVAQIRSQLLMISSRFWVSGLTDFWAELCTRDGLLSQQVSIQVGECGDQLLTGTVMGIDEQGRFRLRTADGQTHTLVSGRIIDWQNDRILC